VYQLGLLLFLLLTGRWPYRRSESSPDGIARAILDEEPTRPSAAVGSALPDSRAKEPTTPAEVARDRATTPSRLKRALDGDLDNIVLKALRKQPERRYADVGHLIDDVESHLAGRPVKARPDAFGYRLGKFVRRHWLLVAAGGLVVTSLSAGLVVAAYQGRRAERRFEEVRRLSRALLFDLHEVVAPLQGSTRAREMIVATSLRYLDSLAKEAGDDATLLRELAEAYERVGARLEGASPMR
jgi:hypothetical protein